MGQPTTGEVWWAFDPTDDVGPSAIDMSDWLDRPAGKHGFVQIDGDRFVFVDGQPIRFWGINNISGYCAPQQSVARFRAARYAKYGVNCVRMHKFTYHGPGRGIGSADDSTVLDPEGLDRFDNYCDQLRRKGIYYGWSHIYGHELRPGDRDKIIAYEQIMSAGGTTAGLVNFAYDLQDLHIQLTVNMLNHRNPYTGLRYADDPALAFVELQNEDDIFFPVTLKKANKCPAYKRLFRELFSDWLKKKYGSHAGLVEAWGYRALNAFPQFQKDEHLDKRNIYPIAHDWWFGPDGIRNERGRGTLKRLSDTARFLYETQNKFYERFVKAIRDTGYQGPIVGSCWKAGAGVSHYYNLQSDARMGIVDRHRYFGGETGHVLTKGAVVTDSMLSRPGSGLLSAGLEQVAGRPFAMSEWISRVPNEWVAEGPAIVAVYGMGLGGWDASYHFESRGRFPGTIHNRSVYNIDSPTQIGLYPSLARMVHRGDVKQGDPVMTRKVHVDSFSDGTWGERGGTGDPDSTANYFDNPVPSEALAVGPMRVEFVDTPTTRQEQTNLEGHVSGQTITSNTGQLKWVRSGKGYFTVNTPATRGVVGFGRGVEHELGDVTINVDTDFAVVLVTAMGRNKTIATSESILVNAVGRAKNTGMRYSGDRTEVIDIGGPPVVVEPIRATITIDRPGEAVVYVLDHDGRRTDRTVPIVGGRFTIDGARYKTIYYQVVYK